MTGKLPRLAMIGLGNMGEALLSGLISKGVADPALITGVDALPRRAAEVAGKYGIALATSTETATENAKIVLLAVKPKDVEAALSGLERGKLVVSICAGVTLAKLRSLVWDGTGVVRVMPNTPALVGEGASAWVANDSVTPEQAGWVDAIFGSVGRSVRLDDERLMDAVTGLSGSGPAYVFMVIEALADGGVAAGLPRPLAVELAAQTVLGAAVMALGGVAHTAELKDRVCSPGGTTIEGVKKLEEAGLRAALIGAVTAAARRSRELGG